MKYLAILAFLLGILGILHQGIVANQWWKWSDLLGVHHEPLIAGCFVAGMVLLIINYKRA